MAVLPKDGRNRVCPSEATLTLTEAVRKALMSNAGDGGGSHNRPDSRAQRRHPLRHCGHCRSLGREHADGHLMGFAIILPRETNITGRRTVLAACSELRGGGLHIPGVGDWTRLDAADETTMNPGLADREPGPPACAVVAHVDADSNWIVSQKKKGAEWRRFLRRVCRRYRAARTGPR